MHELHASTLLLSINPLRLKHNFRLLKIVVFEYRDMRHVTAVYITV